MWAVETATSIRARALFTVDNLEREASTRACRRSSSSGTQHMKWGAQLARSRLKCATLE